MLPAELLAALDGLPPEEALRRPISAGGGTASRIAALLGGDGEATEALTVGDMLFRWARTEPGALDEADIPEVRTVSAILAATGQVPRRLGLMTDLRRVTSAAAQRNYLLTRLAAHLCDAQGCEAAVQDGDDTNQVLVNGLDFSVQDPELSPPTRIERLTFLVQNAVGWTSQLADNSLVSILPGITGGMLGGMLPSLGGVEDLLGTSWMLCSYAHASAQAIGIILRHDTDAMVRLAGMTSSAAAGHVGHAAAQIAITAVLGATGSWVLVLAPMAGGFAGRVVARNLVRRARYRLFCSTEVAAVQDAISRHCSASRTVLDMNIAAGQARQEQFADLHARTEGPAKAVASDWLNRLEHVQSYRRLAASRLDRASREPLSLDRRDGDVLTAARESLLTGARIGVHPANVTKTAGQLATVCTALQRKMAQALV